MRHMTLLLGACTLSQVKSYSSTLNKYVIVLTFELNQSGLLIGRWLHGTHMPPPDLLECSHPVDLQTRWLHSLCCCSAKSPYTQQ